MGSGVHGGERAQQRALQSGQPAPPDLGGGGAGQGQGGLAGPGNGAIGEQRRRYDAAAVAAGPEQRHAGRHQGGLSPQVVAHAHTRAILQVRQYLRYVPVYSVHPPPYFTSYVVNEIFLL